MVLGRKTNFFLENDGFVQENQLFEGKPKQHLLEHKTARLQKDCCCWFSLGRRWFSVEKPFFPRRKLVFGGRTNILLGENGFGQTNFFQEKVVLGQENKFFPRACFSESGRKVSQKIIAFGKSWFFGPKRCVFGPKPFFPEESWYFTDQIFPSKECVSHLMIARVTN